MRRTIGRPAARLARHDLQMQALLGEAELDADARAESDRDFVHVGAPTAEQQARARFLLGARAEGWMLALVASLSSDPEAQRAVERIFERITLPLVDQIVDKVDP